MESHRRAPLIGLAIARGEVELDALAQVLEEQGASASETRILQVLQERGLISETVLEELRGLEARTSLHQPPQDEPTDPGSRAMLSGPRGATDPWASLPPPSLGPLGGGGEGREVLRALSLPRWKQYRNLRYVAEGGMGRIFKAFDPELKRMTALKFLRRDDPDLARRFVLEAQSQAKVDHPNICKVYEVGEWKGQAYIAMQFIAGETLAKAGPGMSLEQKIEVMEKVCEAMHMAHRQGLIHRDLKPANIMVERQDDGLAPYVLDFGLARGLESSGITIQGTVIGTAHYMSPEQARCEHDKLTRRSDVYALGATLYDLLMGEPPFAKAEGMECLRRVIEEDLPSLRQRLPDLPADLDTIVLKCLEKDPARRYESARALAEDLRRFRDGEPILAHPATLTYRMGKMARKHKALVGVAAGALVIVLAAAGFAIQARISASRRAAWAQHFGQEAERVEALLRYGHLLPARNLEPLQAQAMERIRRMEADVAGAGGLARGPGAYALGRAYLALGDTERAKVELDRAWSLGFRTPEASYALGLVESALYRRAREQALRQTGRELAAARLAELDAVQAPRIQALLQGGRNTTLAPPAWLDALLAYTQHRYADCLGLTREALRQAPWYYEALLLQAEAHQALAQTADPQRALDELDKAREAFRQAQGLAPSDPKLLLGEAQVWADLHRRLPQEGAHLDKALEACQRALTVQPGNLEARTLRAWCRTEQGVLGVARSAPDWQASFRQALEEAEAALKGNPGHPPSLAAAAHAHTTWARMLPVGSPESRAHLGAARQFIRRAQELDPDGFEGTCLALRIYQTEMTDGFWGGAEPWRPFEETLRQALALRGRFPGLVESHTRIAALFLERAEYERTHGLDPRPSARAVRENIERALALKPNSASSLQILGSGWLIEAQYQVKLGQDAQSALAEALAVLRKALDMKAGDGDTWYTLGDACLSRAEMLVERVADPGPALREAQEAFQQAQAIMPGRAEPNSGVAALRLAEARWKAGLGLDGASLPPPGLRAAGRGLLEQARAAIRATQRLMPGFVLYCATEGWICLEQARCAGGGAAALKYIQEGLQQSAQAKRLDPRMAEPWQVEGLLHLARARALKGGAGEREAYAEAAKALAKAVEMDPALERRVRGALQEARMGGRRG